MKSVSVVRVFRDEKVDRKNDVCVIVKFVFRTDFSTSGEKSMVG